jgi:hypothetical protein
MKLRGPGTYSHRLDSSIMFFNSVVTPQGNFTAQRPIKNNVKIQQSILLTLNPPLTVQKSRQNKLQIAIN